MLKSEFESLIGKEVDYDTFEMYERMYNALPEYVGKVEFVKMLNKDNIPESKDAVRRKEENKRIIGDWKSKIEELKDENKYYKDKIRYYKEMLSDSILDEEKAFYKKEISNVRGVIRSNNFKIREYRYLIK